MPPKVSIILPCYKAERYIADIVSDVLAQTYTDWELIVVSNGEGQGAQLAVLDGFRCTMGEDKLIVLSEERGGVSHARNVGMARARGAWIAFVDADDRLTPNHLQLLIDATKTGEPDIIVAGYTEIDPKYMRRREIKPAEEEGMIGRREIAGQLHMVSTMWNLLLRRSLITDSGLCFNTDFAVYEDGIFMSQCLMATERVKALPMCGYQHVFVNEASAVKKYHEEWAEAERMLSELHLQLIEAAGYTEEEVAAERIYSRYMGKQHALHNIFLLGSPFVTSRERVEEAKRLVFDDPEMPMLMQRKYRKRHSKVNRLIGFDLAYDLRSPRYMVFSHQYLLPLVEAYHIRIKERILGRR